MRLCVNLMNADLALAAVAARWLPITIVLTRVETGAHEEVIASAWLVQREAVGHCPKY